MGATPRIVLIAAILGLTLSASACFSADDGSAYCGGCHPAELAAYGKSIHGTSRAAGVSDAPSCTDCHGTHNGEPPAGPPRASLESVAIIRTCSKCHEDRRLQKIYGLQTERLATYRESFHGVAGRFGDKAAPNCATCHRDHDILPASDPASSINKKNLGATCGKCHPGAGEKLAMGSVHVTPSPKKDPVVFWTQKVYMGMITGVVSASVGFIGLDLLSRLRRRLRKTRRR